MGWPPEVSSHNGIVNETTITPWIPQLPNELHRVIVTRTDTPRTQVAFIQVWGSLDKILVPTNPSEDHAIEADVVVYEFAVLGYRFFAIGAVTAAGADSILLNVDFIGNGGT